MSTVNPTSDEVLVYRSGTAYSTTADMSTVNNSDLILVNRSGTDYKCTFADWQSSQLQEPAIDSLSVAAGSGSNRFSSRNFTVTWAMDNEGNPGSTKQFKAYVLKPDNGEGNFPQLKYLLQFNNISSVSSSGSTVTITLTGNTNLSKLNVGDTVRPYNAVLSDDYVNNSTFTGSANWTAQFDGSPGTSGNQSYWYPNNNVPFDSSLQICGGESGYDDKYAGRSGAWSYSVRSNGGCQTARSGAESFSYIGFRDYRGSNVGAGIGAILLDGHQLRRNMYNPCGVVTAISGNTVTITNGDNDQGSSIAKWSSSTGQALCRDFDVNNAKNAATDIFGQALEAPAFANKLYCVLGTNGSVSGFQEDDPGWTTLTDQTSTANIAFPANATRGTCDADFPSNSRLVVEMRAFNSQGEAFRVSNELAR